MGLVSQAEYARHRGVSKQAVGKAVRTGRIQLRDGLVDVEEADRLWPINTDPSRTSNSVTGNPAEARPTNGHAKGPPARAAPAGDRSRSGHPMYAVSRGVRETYLARMARLEYEEKVGELVRASEVREAIFANVRSAREMLMGIADRVAPVVAGLTDVADCHRAINDEVRRACEALGSPERG